MSDPAKIAALVAARRSTLPSDSDNLKRVYRHTFPLARAPGQKAVVLDMAVEYWRVLFSSPSWSWSSPSTPWLDWWLTFLTEKYQRSVNKDLWDQTLMFARKTVEDEQLGFWSEDSAWPAVIDDFVAYVKERRGTSMDLS